MGYLQIILLLVLSLSVVRSNLVDDAGDTVQDVADKAEDTIYGNQANGFKTRCQNCRITRQDSGRTHIYDLTAKYTITGMCPEYECADGLDWCLETYYEHRPSPTQPYDEIREYQCGNKAMRDSRQICRELANEKNTQQDYYRMQECDTKRSSSSISAYSPFLILALLAYKLLL